MQPKAPRSFTPALFVATGMEAEKADAVATYLHEADLTGDTTHGLALAPWYCAWLVATGLKFVWERAPTHGTATLIDQSIASSSPSGAQVAPFGGTRGVFPPSPVAYGIPTPNDPILIDISALITTVNMAQRMMREGRHYDHDLALADACLASPALDQGKSVRLPGQATLARRRQAVAKGVTLYPGILDALNAEAACLSLPALVP